MVKDKPKFDFAISNPPYQRLLSGATITSIYPEFILNASKVSERSTMVHPARAFKGAGRNSKEDVEAIIFLLYAQYTQIMKNINTSIIFHLFFPEMSI